MVSSPSSLLRLLRCIEEAAPTEPATSIGLDDWAYKRRHRYGTLICDLQTGKPLDVLPDRTVQTVSGWLQAHPHVKIISRDRWSEYATAAQQGAPQAQQVADRWHILHTLGESVAAVFPQIRAEMIKTASPGRGKEPSSTQNVRQEQYQELLKLLEQGLRPEQIAPMLAMSERTVYRWLSHSKAASWQHSARSASVIDPYRSYLLKRWDEGCQKGSVLCRELRAQGYRGSERAVYRSLTFLQTESSLQERPEIVLPVVSSKRTTWLLVKEPPQLDENEQKDLCLLRQGSPTAEALYQLVQEFGDMVRQRQAEKLDEWLKKVESSEIAALQAFVAGIRRDKSAIEASLRLPYGNGLLEGHVNRLKLIKRSMYGRANFDLLRLRVLSSA